MHNPKEVEPAFAIKGGDIFIFARIYSNYTYSIRSKTSGNHTREVKQMTESYLTGDEYIMYLRKSRADSPHESVEEVLAKHETILQELAVRDLGGRIPEHCIYREVVSGETISERPEMGNVLHQIENPRLKGVLVVEPQRLSRGDLEDCGKVVNAFRYTGTEIITTNMVYDLSNKMQRKFFEQELMRGNDYLEYTKEILLRGRISAVKRGCFIGNKAPFGYDKTYDENGDSTLVPNDNAPAVLMAFELYVNEGLSYFQIGKRFDQLGIKPLISEVWEKCSIRAILSNKHYAGFVYFGSTKTLKTFENGQIKMRTTSRVDAEEVVIAKGKHPAIVPMDLFEAAQEKMNNNPRRKDDFKLTNPLAGLIFCHKCGKAMISHPYPHAETRLECRNRHNCKPNSVKLRELIEAVVFALEMEHLPDLEVKLKNNEGNSAAIQKKQLEKMNKELEELQAKEERQHDLLESGTYSEETFLKRNKALHAQMEELKSKIFDARQSIPKEIDYEGKIIKLKDAIACLRNDSMEVEDKNRLLKAIVQRIEYDFIERVGAGRNVKTRFALHIWLLL